MENNIQTIRQKNFRVTSSKKLSKDIEGTGNKQVFTTYPIY